MSQSDSSDQLNSVIILGQDYFKVQAVQKEQIQKLEQELQQKDKEIAKYKNDCQIKDIEIKDMKKVLEQVKQFEEKVEKFNQSQSQNSLEQLKEYKRLKQLAALQQAEIKILKEQQYELTQKTTEIVQEKEEFQQQNNKIMFSLYNRKAQLQTLTKEKEDYENEIDNLKKTIQNLQSEVEILKQENYELGSQQKQSLNIQKDLEFQLEQFKGKYAKLETFNFYEYLNSILEMQCERIKSEIMSIDQENIEYRVSEMKRKEFAKQLNSCFLENLRKPLAKHYISFKSEFRDNRIRE